MNKTSILAAIALILFSSCSSNSDDSEQTQTSEIIGKWFYVNESYDSEGVIYPDGCFDLQYFQFFSNGIVSIKNYDEPCGAGDSYFIEGAYYLEGNRLELTGLTPSDDGNYFFDVTTLNETTLILEASTELTENYKLELKKE